MFSQMLEVALTCADAELVFIPYELSTWRKAGHIDPQDRETALEQILATLPMMLIGVQAIVLPGSMVAVPPEHYGSATTSPHDFQLTDKNNIRLDIEKWLITYSLANHIPILGICRGMQLMNVALGGGISDTLANYHAPDFHWDREYSRMVDAEGKPLPLFENLFHLGKQEHYLHHLIHGKPLFKRGTHSIVIDPESCLKKILLLAHAGKSIQHSVLSIHWHGIRLHQMAENLLSTAWSDDVVEAFEHREHPCYLGFQFHPEASVASQTHHILKYFIGYAGQYNPDDEHGACFYEWLEQKLEEKGYNSHETDDHPPSRSVPTPINYL